MTIINDESSLIFRLLLSETVQQWEGSKYFRISNLKNVKHGGFKHPGIPSNPILVSVLSSVQNQTVTFGKPQNYLES